jgi:hypothetical protein
LRTQRGIQNAAIANKAKQSGKLRQCCRHFKESIAVIANEVKQSSKTKMLFLTIWIATSAPPLPRCARS